MSLIVERSAWTVAHYSGLNAVLRRRARRRLLVLCYHGVVAEEAPEDEYRYRNTVGVATFRKQLSTISRLLNPVCLDDVLMAIRGVKPLPPYSVLVTFDDGYRNNLIHAAPVLEEYGVPAVFHVTTDYIGRTDILWTQELHERVMGWTRPILPMPDGSPDVPIPLGTKQRIRIAEHVRAVCKQVCNEARIDYLNCLRSGGDASQPLDGSGELFAFMTWEDVRALHQRGFEIGSHTLTHPILSRLTNNALQRELRRSKAIIEERVGTACRCIAYPNGGRRDVSPTVISEVRSAGYQIGLTTIPRLNSIPCPAFEIGRIGINREVKTGELMARISGSYSLFQRLNASARKLVRNTRRSP